MSDQSSIDRLTLPASDEWQWHWTVAGDQVVPSILEAASNQQVDLIAMTTCGHDGVMDSIAGSTTEQVLRAAPCPLLAVHGQMPARIRIPHIAEVVRQFRAVFSGRRELAGET